MEHAAALAVPSYPLAQVHPVTEKLLVGVKLTSFLLVLSYPVVEVGVMQFGGVEHTTPPLSEEAAAQAVPPYEVVHGLLSEQVVILEVSPLMSIVDSELIMLTEPALVK